MAGRSSFEREDSRADYMDAKGIPFRKQNEMLALLAPMNRDIITPPESAGKP